MNLYALLYIPMLFVILIANHKAGWEGLWEGEMTAVSVGDREVLLLLVVAANVIGYAQATFKSS